jgi:hypothetical protein
MEHFCTAMTQRPFSWFRQVSTGLCPPIVPGDQSGAALPDAWDPSASKVVTPGALQRLRVREVVDPGAGTQHLCQRSAEPGDERRLLRCKQNAFVLAQERELAPGAVPYPKHGSSSSSILIGRSYSR